MHEGITMDPHTKVVKMMLEKAPNPPVGSAFVNEISTMAQTVRSVKPSTERI